MPTDEDREVEALACPCGYENFERVTVPRAVPLDPYVTDFVACVGCKTMYWAPRARVKAPEPPLGRMMGVGGPDPNYTPRYVPPDPPRPLTADEALALQEIKAAAARANKSKKRR